MKAKALPGVVAGLLLALQSGLSLASGPTFGEEITDLPGAPSNLHFKQSSGYATVDQQHGRRLFYWFVESQSSPSTDPLVLWLNGGPGCSSLDGFFTEHGPFRPNQNMTLSLFEYAWNKEANMIYLESPSGVGFSFSEATEDYVNPNDKRSADDIVTFLVQFIEANPEFKGRPFYITGESYGGHYVPTTAQAVVEHNKRLRNTDINLKGILVGNAWSLPAADNLGVVETWLGYNMIEKELGEQVVMHCNLSGMLPIKASDDLCDRALNQIYLTTAHLNPYDIYADLCLERADSSRSAFLHKMATSGAPLHKHMYTVLSSMQDASPCEENYATAYLNLPEVQRAIHARPTKWAACNMNINGNYSREDFLRSMLPVHEYLLENGLRTFIYSGDVDTAVPTHGTRNWLAKFAASGTVKESAAWAPWTDSTKQVGGWAVRYGPQFTFATVRGAGHMVPISQPVRALDVFTRFLKDSF